MSCGLENDNKYYNVVSLASIINSYLSLQVAYPDNLQPCLLSELLALRGQWLYFAPPIDGKSPSFTVPGFINVVLKRVE